MKSSQDCSGRALKIVAFGSLAAVAAIFFYPLYVNMLPLVPLWVAVRAKHNAPQVQIGMSDAQVWSTLGLSGRGLRAHVSGSGPPEAYPANYGLWPGYILHMRWNLKAHPATLVELQFRDHLQKANKS